MKNLFYLLVMLISFGSQAQLGSSDYRVREGAQELLTNVSKEYNSIDIGEVEGSMYFNEGFSEGRLFFGKEESKEIYHLRYNAYMDEFEVKEGEKIKFLMRAPGVGCKIGDKKYVFQKYDPGKGQDAKLGYLIALYENEHFAVYLNQKKIFKEGNKAETSLTQSWPDKLVDLQEYYFLDKSNDIAELISKKSKPLLSRSSDSDGSMMTKFAKKDKINFKVEEDILRFYQYYFSQIVSKS
jgi:uncharacterized protein YneR